MPSELDLKYDAVLAKVTGEGGLAKYGEDAQGRQIVANFPQTLPMFFTAFCAMNGGTEALVSGDERLTFAELDQVSTKLAKALVARGIDKGDRVGIAMRNCTAWVICHMAILKAGGISTLLNGWWQMNELAHALKLTDPKLVIADGPRAERIAASGHDCEVITLPIEKMIEEAIAPLIGELDIEDAELPQVMPDDDATILFTSGSTGDAKGAVSTHQAVCNGVYSYSLSLATLKGLLEMQGRDVSTPRTIVAVPFFHVTGEVPVLLNSFVIGRGMVLMHKWDAGEALKLIEKEKITYFVGVPTMSMELMNHPDRENYDLSSLTDVAAGGAPRPVAHVKRLQESFPSAQPALGYGLTETNAVGCGNFWQSYAAKPNSTGRALPMVEVRICGANDKEMDTGQPGEVQIRTAGNIRGYWRNEEATKATLTADGAIRTGDVGYLDEEGYLFIVDRLKDIIIRGGENIATPEVEAAIYTNENIAEASVFAGADERLGEVPVAVIYCHPGKTVSEKELQAFLCERLAAFKVPERMIFVDEPLPKLGTGKIDRVTLKKQYADG